MELHQLILVAFSTKERLYRGGGAAKYNGYMQYLPQHYGCIPSVIRGSVVLLLISWLVLFIKYDNARVRQWRKERRTRPNHYIDFPRAYAPPLIVPLTRSESAVHHGDPCPKPAAE